MTDLDTALAFFDRHMTKLHNDVVPKGFFTAQQMAEKKSVSKQYLKAQLDRLVEEGNAKCLRLKIGNHRVAHYKILV